MELLRSLVIIFVIKVLLLEIVTGMLLRSGLIIPHYDSYGTNLKLPYYKLPEVNYNLYAGICTEVISRQISQYVPYTETYRTRSWTGFYQIKTRQNYRIEFHTIQTTQKTCCEGYQKIGLRCDPYCATPCGKGVCIAPNLCKCDEGYQNMENTNSTKCQPVCASDCKNGICVEPNICKCNDGYWMDTDGLTCSPVCDKECERNNGFCSKPHVCSCQSGYKQTGDELSHKCEPICTHGCINAYCIAPDICKCMEGYEKNFLAPDYSCLSRCSEVCVYGKCTAPETCTCDRGYKAVNASVCEPICSEPCKMGVCVAPESCNCNDGYGLTADSKYICKPICRFNCNNGTCTAPGVCTCDKGFFYDNSTETVCKPICEVPCGKNGKCISPNNCTCFKGYRAIPLNTSNIIANSTGEFRSICQPVCDYECTNGICIAPDVCICKDGYTKDKDNHCVPLCVKGCTNGTCTGPNRCTCNSGFKLRNESVCEPICEYGCENGDCVAPNHCVCHDNFVKNTSYDFVAECIPVCTQNCSGHGECAIDDEYKCNCSFGWRGEDCEEPTMCVVTMNFNYSAVYINNRITILNDMDNAVRQTLADAPYCYQCDNSLSNESLCYAIYSDKANATSVTISCLLSTDLPCYTMPLYNASLNRIKIVGPIASVAILILIGLTATMYLMYRKHQRNQDRLTAGNSAVHLIRNSLTESLSSENHTSM